MTSGSGVMLPEAFTKKSQLYRFDSNFVSDIEKRVKKKNIF